jgi:hypothetical protein
MLGKQVEQQQKHKHQQRQAGVILEQLEGKTLDGHLLQMQHFGQPHKTLVEEEREKVLVLVVMMIGISNFKKQCLLKTI